VIYTLPKLPKELQVALQSKDVNLFGPAAKARWLLTDALYDDLRKRGIMWVFLAIFILVIIK